MPQYPVPPAAVSPNWTPESPITYIEINIGETQHSKTPGKDWRGQLAPRPERASLVLQTQKDPQDKEGSKISRNSVKDQARGPKHHVDSQVLREREALRYRARRDFCGGEVRRSMV